MTCYCALHSFSVLLQQKETVFATVFGILWHTLTNYGWQTYKRICKKVRKLTCLWTDFFIKSFYLIGSSWHYQITLLLFIVTFLIFKIAHIPRISLPTVCDHGCNSFFLLKNGLKHSDILWLLLFHSFHYIHSPLQFNITSKLFILV